MAEIKKVGYTHDAMIDFIVGNPWVTNNEIARHFGYTVPWVSTVINSDAFRERLAQRREDVVDPLLRTTLEERIRGVLDLSLQVIAKNLEVSAAVGGNINAAIRVLEHGSRALGYGAQSKQPSVVVQNYVAVVPPKSMDSQAWTDQHAPAEVPQDPQRAPFKGFTLPPAETRQVKESAPIVTNGDILDAIERDA
jgi:hypothetical protein